MIPVQEKAEELIKEFMPYADGVDRQEDHDQIEEHLENAKQCALIAVDKIDDIYQKLTPKGDPYYFLLELEYWQEVKQEIKNYDR